MGHFIIAAGIFDPIVGAGVPSLVIALAIAYGIYRLRKRRRKEDQTDAEPHD
jgi:hypothetical protein